ncbi:MAG: DUF2723 domain-containing protein [Bacteroidales bacterium]|nr:DUF2723 domain-containing protein [Bacteroidales bacterium]
MKNYNLINNITGWVVFLIATVTFVLTIEPTASFWDCGEFIASSYKLEVGHPPGAPLFMIIARFFSLFAMGDVMQVAKWVNIMSALSSSFTILFLFWTITHFSKAIVKKVAELNLATTIGIMSSGVVGALAYTWSDTFWFSAVEGEVYAMSSFFTAVVVWAILKWENIADEAYANRWLILIFYLIGLSIGVHLLNLLAIPAIVFVYYFRKYKVTRNGVILASAISVALLGGIMYVLIPHSVTVASWFELMFVNGFGMPIHSGSIAFAVISLALLGFGIWYTDKKGKVILNTVFLSITVIMIGYSSFTMIVIRSNANPPMDENNPDNVFSLLSYLNREQYGDRPLFYGQYYNAPIIGSDETFNYFQVGDTYKEIPWSTTYKYDPRFETFFPRMYSSQANHIEAYKQWADIKGKKLKISDYGEAKTYEIPTFQENIKYFLDYQMDAMFFRYFLWNFVGRQNDIQGHGNFDKGNWISGFSFIDDKRVGPQENLPDSMKNNKGRNVFYFLPLILGVIGIFFQYIKDIKQFWVTLLFFFMTGIAIIIYLNQYPYQPRERDYAYAVSFYVYAIWIGLGVLGLFFAPSKITDKEMGKMIMFGAGIAIGSALIALMFGAGTGFALLMLSMTGVAVIVLYLFKLMLKPVSSPMISAVLVFVLTMAIPLQMVSQTWDDHDRSDRYTARDFAHNYLDSCAPNAVLFTNGDNDTFPLWYAQEVEGYRTDVRVVNLSLLNTEWYIDQMKRKAYDSEPVPFSFTPDQYMHGVRDVTPFVNRVEGSRDIKELIAFVKSENPAAKVQSPFKEGDKINYFPTRNFSLKIDSAEIVNKGVVSPNDAGKIVKEITWKTNKSYALKADLMVLDLISNFDWNRPVYFAITVGSDGYNNLEDYFQLEGLAYRFVPIKAKKDPTGQTGSVNADVMYDNMMNKFKWGGLNNPDVYLDENNLRMTMNLRNNFTRLANALLEEGKRDKAVEVLDRCLEVMPMDIIPVNYFMIGMVEAYYKAGEFEKAKPVIEKIVENSDQDLNYYLSLDKQYRKVVDREINLSMYLLQSVYQQAKSNGQDELADNVYALLEKYHERNEMLKGGR